MQADQDGLRRKNEELTQALRDKNRKLLQTQELYDKLKRRAMLGQVQDAAHDAVDDTILASSTANRFVDRVAQNQNQNQNQRRASHSTFQNVQNGGDQANGGGINPGMNMMPPGINRTWSGFGSQGSQGASSRK